MEPKNKPDDLKTIHIAVSFIYVVNYCLSVGFLGIPYAFYYSGYLAAIPTLLVIMVASWNNANYLVECMARAQALESYRYSETQSESKDNSDDIQHPKFEIAHKKFELVEMFELFYGKWAKYIFLFFLTIYLFLVLWPYSIVAGSAWASNIPFNFSTVQQCAEDDFQHAILPPEPCLNAYYVSLSIFGVIVILLSLLDLKEQAIVQMTLGILRFINVGAIVVYCIVNIALSGNKCMVDGLPSVNLTPYTMVNTTQSSAPIRLFNVVGWIGSIPVFAYAINLHTGIPALTQPVKQKKYIHWMLATVFSTVGVCFLALGIFVSLWFRADIQETYTLNWGELTKPTSSLALRILSYCIILFPSLDVIAAFPLTVHVLVNNIYVIITGKDTSEKPTHRFARYDLLFRLMLRLVAASVPVLMAFGVSNFIAVAKYVGPIGLLISYGSPIVLQLRSIHLCKKTFNNALLKDQPVEMKQEGLVSDQDTTLQQPSRKIQSKKIRSLYMTPYSNILSHPIIVCVFGAIGVVLFCLTVASLFLFQKTEVCNAEFETDSMLFDNYREEF